jgi:hypothetical protein
MFTCWIAVLEREYEGCIITVDRAAGNLSSTGSTATAVCENRLEWRSRSTRADGLESVDSRSVLAPNEVA